MKKVTNLLLLWTKRLKEEPAQPISFRNRVCIFTALPTLHVGLTQESLKQSIDELQSILQSKGFLAKPSGRFDLETQKAVEDFQRQNHLHVDGIVGAITWAALHYPRLCRCAQAGAADRQDAVRTLQTVLRQTRLYHGKLDGQFNKETERAVKSFQRAYGLTADGVVGALTWAVLLGRRQEMNGIIPILGGIYLRRSELLRLWQEICIISYIVLGMYFSPVSGNRLNFTTLGQAITIAIALTCVVPFLPDRLLPKQRGNQRPILLQYAPYVLIGLFSNSVLSFMKSSLLPGLSP